eukprot:2000167-Rhodomonas_salina.1
MPCRVMPAHLPEVCRCVWMSADAGSCQTQLTPHFVWLEGDGLLQGAEGRAGARSKADGAHDDDDDDDDDGGGGDDDDPWAWEVLQVVYRLSAEHDCKLNSQKLGGGMAVSFDVRLSGMSTGGQPFAVGPSTLNLKP